jgi:hypothetical protein
MVLKKIIQIRLINDNSATINHSRRRLHRIQRAAHHSKFAQYRTFDAMKDFINNGVLTGRKGPQGERGKQGEKGVEGPPGDKGAKGQLTVMMGTYISKYLLTSIARSLLLFVIRCSSLVRKEITAIQVGSVYCDPRVKGDPVFVKTPAKPT